MTQEKKNRSAGNARVSNDDPLASKIGDENMLGPTPSQDRAPRKPDSWMPLYIGECLADTMHLTRDQIGAYLLLLMAYWRKGGPLAADDVGLATIVRATPNEWRKLRPILAKFFHEQDGLWHQKRADIELARANALTSAKSRAGKLGAENRWHSHNDANAAPMAEPSSSQRQNDAPLPSPLPAANKLESSNDAGGKKAGNENGFDKNTTTIKNAADRMSRFQQKIASELGNDGWKTVIAATDHTSPNFDAALMACKASARRLKKGWPRNWPTSPDALAALATA